MTDLSDFRAVELDETGEPNVIPRGLAIKKIASRKPMRIYWGIDPTGSKVHLGHAVPLRKMKEFSDAGHEVIMLIGSFTAMIGDPSGKDAMREPLTREQVEENFKTYKEQAAKILDFDKVEIRYNHEWLEKLGFKEIVEIASRFTVQQIEDRDMFKRRRRMRVECPNCKFINVVPPECATVIQIAEDEKDDEFKLTRTYKRKSKINCEKCEEEFKWNKQNLLESQPIGSHEFLYPLMVAYDSVMLDVDCELGGNDQLFNMLCGRTLQKAYGKREKFVLPTKLLVGLDGRKMSKTYDNCVYLTDEPSDMFGKLMSLNDDLMETYFECCTDVPMKEIPEILKGNPRDAKARLAREIVTLYHGESAAKSAEKAFINQFKDGGIPDDIPEAKVEKGSGLIEILVKQGLIKSKSEGRRLIEQKGIKVNDKVVEDVDAVAEKGIVKVGKKRFLRIKSIN